MLQALLPFCNYPMHPFLLLLLALFLGSQSVFAHGDLDERIANATKEIQQTPDDAGLYLKRGTLHFQHEDYPRAIRDFKQCSKLGMDVPMLHYRFAQSYSRKNAYRKALKHLDKVLKVEPHNVKALRLKAFVFYKKKNFVQAANLYEKVLLLAKESFPENYLEASRAWEHSRNPEQQQNAITVLENGLDKLGEIHVLNERLVFLFLKNNDFTAALEVQSKVVNSLNRKEHALYKRALIFQKAGMPDDAKADLELALELTESLPRRFKATKAIVELKENITKALQE